MVNVVTVSYPTFADGERVYALHVQPTSFEAWDGGVVHRYTPSEGMRARLSPAPRYSAKTLDALVTDPYVLTLAADMHARIVARLAVSNEDS
jgi:hypothetical protein